MKSMKNILINFLLVIAGIIAGMLIMELGISLFSPQPILQATAPDIFFVRYDEEIGWVNKEGVEGIDNPNPGIPTTTIRINQLGFRGKPVSVEKPSGMKRILFIGDSNTFGYGIEESQRYSDLLSRKLARDYEVVNLGVFGYGTDQEAILFERDGIRYRPDIVIFGFSAGDLSDNMNSINWGTNKPFFKIEGGRLVIHNYPVPRISPFMKTTSRTSPYKNFFYNHSHLYRLVLKRLMASNIYIHDSVKEMREDEALKTTAAILKGVDTLCRENDCRLAVLLISHGEWIAALKKNPDLVVGYYPAFKNILLSLDIPVIDTTDAFIRHYRENEPLFYMKDPVHLTARGNEVVAEVLSQALVERGFIEEYPRHRK